LLQTSFLWGQRCPLPFAPPAEQRRETPLQNQSHASWIHATLRLAQRQDADPQRSQRELIPCMSFLPLLELREYLRTILDTRSTLIDEIIDLYDRFMGTRFSKAKRKHSDRFQKSGKAINDKVRLYSRIGRALLEAKQLGGDPFAAIEAIIPWDLFSKSINDAKTLAQPENFACLSLIGDGFNQLRRYTPTLLEALTMKAAPSAQDLLAGVEVLKGMNERQARKVPDDAPTSFVRKRWESLVQTPEGLDRRFYELCVLSELKNALRSGNIWVQGSRQFKDFEEYHLPVPRFSVLCERKELGLVIETNCERFLEGRLALLEHELATVERLAAANELPDAAITDTAGFTYHVFALMPPLGFRFAPRIRDLADKRLYICGNPHLQTDMESLKPLHQM
jgi:hypothetical protein